MLRQDSTISRLILLYRTALETNYRYYQELKMTITDVITARINYICSSYEMFFSKQKLVAHSVLVTKSVKYLNLLIKIQRLFFQV